MIGMLAHPQGGRQPIDVVQRMTLHEVLDWSELFGEVSNRITMEGGNG